MIFDAPRGYVATFFPECFDFDMLLAYGTPFRCVDPGMAIKFYPSKYPTHFVITAALGLHSRNVDPRDIREVRICAPDIDDADRPLPRSGLEGKFSFQYTASVALLDGKVGIASFTDERRFAPDLVDLLGKCVVERDPTKSNDTRSMQVETRITLKDGRTLSEICSRPLGSWGQPIDPLQHGIKVRDCLSVRFDVGQVERIVAALDELGRFPGRRREDRAPSRLSFPAPPAKIEVKPQRCSIQGRGVTLPAAPEREAARTDNGSGDHARERTPRALPNLPALATASSATRLRLH